MLRHLQDSLSQYQEEQARKRILRVGGFGLTLIAIMALTLGLPYMEGTDKVMIILLILVAVAAGGYGIEVISEGFSNFQMAERRREDLAASFFQGMKAVEQIRLEKRVARSGDGSDRTGDDGGEGSAERPFVEAEIRRLRRAYEVEIGVEVRGLEEKETDEEETTSARDKWYTGWLME